MSPRVLSVLLVLIPFAITSCGGEANRPVQSTTTPEQKNPAAPLVPKVEIHDWCKEHGVPESICTRCNESLVAGRRVTGATSMVCPTHSASPATPRSRLSSRPRRRRVPSTSSRRR